MSSANDTQQRQGNLVSTIFLWLVLSMLVLLPLVVLLLWSVAGSWLANALLPVNFTWRHWRTAGLDVSLLAALLRSLGIACVVTVLAVALAIPAAWALTRSAPSLRRALELFVLAPLIVPGLVIASSLGRLFLDVDIAYGVTAVVLAQIVGVLPVTIRVLTAAFDSLPAELWWAARALGASPWQAMLQVMLPLSAKPLAVVATLAAITSFEEFDRSFIVGSPITETLPVRLYFLLDGASTSYPGAAVASLLLILPVLIITVAEKYRSRAPSK